MIGRMDVEPDAAPRRPAGMQGASRALFVTVILVVAVVVAACRSGVSTAPGPLVTIETRGGECFAAPCGQTVILELDGSVHAAAMPPNALGTITPAQLETLSTLIATTDFDPDDLTA